MNFMTILTSAVLVGSAPLDAIVQPPGLTAAANAFDAAQIHGDRAALDALLADDYVLLNGDDSQEDRVAFIKDFTQPGFRLNPFVVKHPLVRTWPGGAVMGGLVRLTGHDSGKPFDHCIRFSDIWSLRGGKWKVAFTHVSRPPPGACEPAV